MKALLIFTLLTACAVAEDFQQFVLPKANQSIAPPETLETNQIINGRLARRRQLPYQVGLMLDYGDGGELMWCGATLISSQWILTAAHCTYRVVAGYVHLGAVNRTNPNEPGQKIIRIEKDNIIVHENWDPNTFVDDISLIKLPTPVKFNTYIRPARLPKMSGNYSDYSGAKVIASGWGRTKDSETIVTEKLRWIEVPIMSNSDCARYYNHPTVTDTNICISPIKGRSICHGDSGGPLILADGSQTVIGATSFGLASSCEKSFPGVFTRITSFLDWIAKHTGIVNE